MRRPRPLPLIAAGLLAWPVLEVLLIIQVGHLVGATWTLLLLVVGVVLGAVVLRREGRRSWRLRSEGFADRGWVVLGGVLLIVPGFLTDLLAVLMLVPVTRRALRAATTHLVRSRSPWLPPSTSTPGSSEEPRVVRGDVL